LVRPAAGADRAMYSRMAACFFSSESRSAKVRRIRSTVVSSRRSSNGLTT
jgi:hypothetical protein